MRKHILFSVGLNFLCTLCFGQVVLQGRVSDAQSGEALPYVNIGLYHNGALVHGCVTDRQGKYSLEYSDAADSVQFGFAGYVASTFALSDIRSEKLNVALQPHAVALEAVEVSAKRQRYKRKDNPAVSLMKKVVEQKDQNSIKGFDYYEYSSHIKTEISLLGITDSTKDKGLFKNIQYVFDNLQTSPLSGKKYLPMYFSEQLKEHYYRKSPKSEKSILKAQKEVQISKFLDPESVENILNEIVSEVDLFDDKVHILSNDFVSPLSSAGVALYHFYLSDTVVFDDKKCVKVLFNPANVRDIGFGGTLWISTEGDYSLVHSLLGVDKKSGLNFVKDLSIEQTYKPYNGKMVKTADKINAERNIYGLSLFVRKQNIASKHVFDAPQKENFYSGIDLTERLEGYNRRLPAYWEENRLEALTPSESLTYSNALRLNDYSAYKLLLNTLMAFTSGYVEVGKIDIGRLENFVSWNDVEGLRLRIGGKTNMNFNKHLFFEGFVAYGFKDHRLKFRTCAMYSFAEKRYNQWEFPKNLLSIKYEQNTKIHGQSLLMGEADRFFLSFNRGKTDKMSFDRLVRVEYEYETTSQLSLKTGVQYLQEQPLAGLKFISFDKSKVYNKISSPSFDIELRYAKGEKFFQQQQYRLTINTTAPIITLNYTYGTNLFGNDYEYHKIKASIEKRFYLWTFGYADIALQGGKIWGGVPFPLMFVHHANQNWAYQDEAFNLMNYYEFVSDSYAQMVLNYNFNGYIFNRIPLLKHLNWREVFAFKVLWGGVSDKNMPSEDNPALVDFPRNEQGCYSTFALGETPYIEANIGVDNIFKVLRVDYVRRFTHLDNPDIAKWGIRFRLRFTF